MSLSNGTINGAEIVSDGLLIAGSDDALVIYPEPGDRNYSIRIEIHVDSTNAIIIPTATVSNVGGPLIEIKRGWHGGQTSANTKLLIGETPEHQYYLNFTLTLIGFEDRYAIEFRYVVFRKTKS